MPAPNLHHRKPSRGTPGRVADSALFVYLRHPFADLVAIDHQASEGGENEESQEDVEHPQA